jgi:hypothetical protein
MFQARNGGPGCHARCATESGAADAGAAGGERWEEEEEEEEAEAEDAAAVADLVVAAAVWFFAEFGRLRALGLLSRRRRR